MWQDYYSLEEFRAEIKRLVFDEGLSMSGAAKAIGHGVTKNMVVRQCQTIRKTASKVTFPDSVWPSEPKSGGERAREDELEIPVHITRVKEKQCRAPLWSDLLHSKQRVDPSDHMLCGKKCRDGSSWCQEHHDAFFPSDLQKRPTKKRRNEVKDNSAQFQ